VIGRPFRATPTDPHESAELLQHRLRVFGWALGGLLGGLWVLNGLLNAAFYSSYAEGQFLSARSFTHGAIALYWGALSFALRSRSYGYRALVVVDAASILLGGVAAGLMIVLGQAEFRTEMVLSMGLAHVLALRAAVVPSTAVRTAVLGVLAETPVLIGAYWLHSQPDHPPYLPGAASVVASMCAWALLSIATSTVISSVIYGLERRVKDAVRLGQYTLEQKLGEGGMGVVYRARHALLRRPTAVKLLHPERTGEEAVQRFEREVQCTARISHPSVVSVYDFGRTSEGTFYYAMEYLDGIDLERLVREDGPQHPGRVRHLLAQAADALADAHAVGLIHRDIKPSNLIVCERPRKTDRLKIVDFGLVKERADSSMTQSGVFALKGTPLYLAPEAMLDPASVDARTDLYALGAVGFILLTATPVFSAESLVELCGKHMYTPPPRPSERVSGVPASLERVILDCLAKKPSDRPADAAVLLDLLRACDDCPEWTPADARQWWKERAPVIRSKAEDDVRARTPSEKTLGVDPRGRT
jgi:serine/threonine-protein kinase